MGEFADAVNGRLRDGLAERLSRFEWSCEYPIGSTRADIGGDSPEHLVLVELEWRRADPADNTAKLFRHLSGGTIEHSCVSVFQVFTGKYDLVSGGVESRRRNAEFVGRVAADAVDELSYRPVEFPMTPPKRGDERPEDWVEVTDRVAERIASLIE